nr:hypothetical protein [Amylibacter sp.]
MAYLDPKTLRCPKCDYQTDVTIVVGVGPHSKSGDTPYKRHQRNTSGVEGDTITCPNDGTVLWTDIAGHSA